MIGGAENNMKDIILAGGNGSAVRPLTTVEYYASARGPIAPRPEHSALDFSKLEAAGFHMHDLQASLRDYVLALLGGDVL